MITRELDPDVVRWGLHHLNIFCLAGGGSPRNKDQCNLEYVREGYCENVVENDEAIAHVLQDEFSRIAVPDPSGSSRIRKENQPASVFYNDRLGPLNSSGHHKSWQDEGERGKYKSSSSLGENSFDGEAVSCSPEIADESILDGELGKRINQMVPVPHVPKINGEIPSVDEETSDHQRLMDRLQLYDLVELKVSGDGNCQFRSLSDQIYRTSEHHKFVREQIVDQLNLHPELYEGYVPMAFDDYVKKMRKVGEWGDHVTLQAAADVYGVKIFIITSFKDTCYIEILPHVQKSKRIIFLSFWAEVHYNSIYPQGGGGHVEFAGGGSIDLKQVVKAAAAWELAAVGGEHSRVLRNTYNLSFGYSQYALSSNMCIFF